jgi:hypothetical protein
MSQPLTKITPKNLHGVKERPVRKADNITATCELIVQKILEPRRLTAL